MPETKLCCNCDIDKPLEDFNRHKKKPDGRQTFCRECQKAEYRGNKERHTQRAREWTERNREKRYGYAKKWKQANPEAVAKINRRYRERNPEMGKKHERLYYKRHPGREKANRAVRKAIQTGRLVKPSCCQRCAQSKKPSELDGHHSDYSKPLEVVWLDRQCHVDTHKEERGEAPRTEPAPSFNRPKLKVQLGDLSNSSD